MKVLRHLLLWLVCFAVASTASAASVRASGPSIFVNEVEVIRFRATTGGRSAVERAAYLAPLLQDDLGVGGIAIAPIGKEYRLIVGGKYWALASSEEARAVGMTSKALAESWRSTILAAVALPSVKLAVRQLKVPAGGTRTLPMVGGHVQEAMVQSSDDNVVRASRNGASLSLLGVSPGSAKVEVSFGSVTATVEITVQPMAAYFPQAVTVCVTGTPANRDTVAGSLAAAVNSDLRTVDGAQVGFSPPPVTEIGTGESRSYLVHVNVAGPQSFPSEGLVNVTVKNTPIGYRGETELWYSNDPERVTKPMRLFVAGLKAGEPVRMLYHHINRSGSTMFMNVEAINNTKTPARLLIIPGDADPGPNPVAAGFEAADRFVRSWSKYSGEIVDIPPYSILPISLRRMNRLDTVSGLCYLRLLDGGPEQLIVRAAARRPSLVDRKWKLAMSSPTPWRIGGCKKIGDVGSVPMPDAVHIYPNPFKEEDVTYTVGGPYGFVRIGQTPIAQQDNHGSLDGNFGVVYTIKANIENNTSAAAEVEVVYEASAGYGGALFFINGDYRRTPWLQAKEETRLSHFRLDPGASRLLRIMTLPLSGSAYPCTLIIRPVGPVVRNNAGG
ncbi:MAG: Ig domain-containing protein [Fimbriimonadales bacterium]